MKERILEYLAVQQRVRKLKGPILCLVGPPGVGKTSLGQSIARATGRKFVRMSLGGVRDEAEIRGHRRTYIGALPGKIVQNLAKAGVRNPLFLLDEVDKMSMDFRGDPSSALLEVLDPEQNHTFNDHYLEVDYDLSEVMFVATANTMNIPDPLLDRMEVIRLAGYTEPEKVNIAKRYLVPKQMKNNGVKPDELGIGMGAVQDIIRYYTREAGVRNMEREIAKICRKVVKETALKPRTGRISVNHRNVERFLGVKRFRYGRAEDENRIGQVTGLAWTEVGGDLLTIEAAVTPGTGKPSFTGRLGDVMQESIKAAMTVVRGRASSLGVDGDFYQKHDVHLHVPEGATPKDGPSAGVGMLTAIVSALTRIAGAIGRRDDRRDHAARRGAAGRGAQGEAAGCAPGRDPDRPHSRGEQARARRDSEGHQAGARHPPRPVGGRGPDDCPREGSGGRTRSAPTADLLPAAPDNPKTARR